MSAQALVAVMDATLLEIDIYQQSVLMGLANCAAEDGTNAWPSVATLAARGRMSERKARDALRALEEARIIRATSISAGRTTTIYALNLPLLAAHKGSHRPAGAGPVDFDAPSPRAGADVDMSEQPGTGCRVEARQPGTTGRQPGTPRHSTRHSVPPNLLEPVQTSARATRAVASPSARHPATGGVRAGPKPEKARQAGRVPMPPAIAALSATDPRRVAWRKLSAALVVRGIVLTEKAAAAIRSVDPDGQQIAASSFGTCVLERCGAASILAEQGWRVVAAGAGGGGRGGSL